MKAFKVLSVLGLVLITTACGNARDINYDLRKSDYGQITNENGTNPYASAAEQCSATANITSSQFNAPSGSSFHACKSTSESSTSVKIFSASDISQTVCIFPLQVNNGLSYPFVINQYSNNINRFAYKCVSTNGQSGATVDFQNLPLNGILVVDQVNALQMANCLMQGNTSSCATNFGFTYSKGSL